MNSNSKRTLSLLLYSVILVVSTKGFASQQCVKECDQRVLQLSDIQRRQDEFRLCYRLCSMEERNPSESYDGDQGRQPAPLPGAPSDDGISGLAIDPALPDDGKSTGSTTNTTKAEDPPCTENFDAEVSACEQATLKAASSCDENNSAMSGVANMAAELTLYAGQKGALGIKESCNKMATLAKAANGALMSYRLLCGSAITTCTAACSKPVTPKCNDSASAQNTSQAREALAGNLSSCQGFSSKMTQASAAAQNYSQMHLNSQSCSLLTSGAPATLEICSTYPDYPGCGNLAKMDCGNPEMAESKVCICSKTPTHPICTTQVSGNRAPTPAIDPSLRVKPKDHSFPVEADSKKLSISSGPSYPAPDEYVPDGRQGSNANLSSPHLSPSLEKRLKYRNQESAQVLGGFYAGGSGTSEKRYEKLDLDPASDKRPKPQTINASTGENPDLSRFLPGGRPRPLGYRGIAGSSETIGVDGITGPNSNIWKKIQNRYRSLQDSLHP